MDLVTGVLRIVQEALLNVERHSGASEANVGLTNEEGQLEVRITDNGIGFNPDEISPDCYGLKIIRQRANNLGGRATVRSAPGEGTEIMVELPGFPSPSNESEK